MPVLLLFRRTALLKLYYSNFHLLLRYYITVYTCPLSGVILDRVSFHGRFVHFHLPSFLPSFLHALLCHEVYYNSTTVYYWKLQYYDPLLLCTTSTVLPVLLYYSNYKLTRY